MSFSSWLYISSWHNHLFCGWKTERHSRSFVWRQWCFQLDFPCQNYSKITEYVRFPIRTSQESHMTLERLDSNLTCLYSLILPKKQSKQRAKRTNEMEKMSNERLFPERGGSKYNRTPNPALTLLTRG